VVDVGDDAEVADVVQTLQSSRDRPSRLPVDRPGLDVVGF
jgi:hypothetical protein